MTKAEAFFKNLKGKKVAFIGIGVSHERLIPMFADCGALVTLCDKKPSIDDFPMYKDMLLEKNISLKLGEDYLKNIDADIIFRTPGMYYNNPELLAYKEKNVVITSEMETFFELCPAKIFAVTGSDGKTTTTTLISEFLKESGKRVYKGGNIGKALLPDVLEMNEEDIAVVELSSFQLISMRRSPDIAVVTNIAPNHLDVHGCMEEYIDSKKNLLLHQSPFSTAVLNYDNEETKKLRDIVRGKNLWFSRKEKVPFGAYLDSDGYLCYTDGITDTKLFNSSDIRIPGIHNVENYLAAIAASFSHIEDKSIFEKVAKSFNGVEHRIEFVRELCGVKYYNDSIASSPTRTIAGLNAFPKKVILIAGGYDKKIPFDILGAKINEKVKLLILDGPTSDKIEAAVMADDSSEKPKIVRSESMEMSVSIARENAESGDIVTLSPACASFDKYRNFEERGNIYKEIVRNLK
ncbi:MAG: UDP-N-acetylmuramoyl-L-alanine--D-glutamate ligase [Oscillospiraceae bacterium]|nr:UDP-N-acetylmuramoyl-L-alanine--D-glutamate ligase [Oscillospiraceae bacterium]